MLMQFNSMRPIIIVGTDLIFFTKDFSRIPEHFRSDYSLSPAALEGWSNIGEIEAEVERVGYTWGVEAPNLPGERKRITGTALLLMQDHD